MFRFLTNIADAVLGLRGSKPVDKAKQKREIDNRDTCRPVLKCSICNGEQVAGFKDIHTGKFEEVMLIRGQKDLDDFMKRYGISEITKEY